MIRDRYEPLCLFALVPQLRLAFEPELAELDRLLDDDALFQAVKAEMARRAPRSLTRGRRSTPVEVVLRMLVVRRLYDWSYAATERCVGDSLVLRQFCRLALEPAPDDTALIRWAGLVRPATLEALHERVVARARGLKVTRGRKLRTDGTVVETAVHYPRDSTLLADGVRVLSRVVRRAKALVGDAVAATAGLFRDRARGAKRLARHVAETARQRGEAAAAARRATYGRLLAVARASLRQAAAVRARLAATTGRASQRLGRQLDRFAPLVERVVAQATRRVLRGEAVPAHEKVVSLFEPHTAVIRRGKAGHPTEFGRAVWLDEVDGGIVSGCRVLAGNPPDDSQLGPSLLRHRRLFGQPPRVVAGDRGVHSPANERIAQEMGVARVALPKPGHTTPDRRRYERQRWFRRAMRFRAGQEGRISVLKRRGYLGRCRDKGEDGFLRWVGWGVITANLHTVARTVAARA
jgi:IS5 family transposase